MADLLSYILLRNKIIKFLSVLLILFVAGCSNQVELEPFEIQHQEFASQTDAAGDRLFSFIAAVKPSASQYVKIGEQMSRSDYKKMLNTDTFDNSSLLRMELEDHAVLLLEQELKQRNYCADKHSIEEVKWREYSVRLSGRCLN
ncbi:hypothetical protein D1819_16700 [Pseudoalteromonas tunicata]|uniref:Putative orphan protein putative signal peptide n=1 Tax=Pseudoalteromonas tunicata D2 TaxID=87626 RepID=A4C822_9GAMM|nr:hypothetical protein D1819_16700 [Pseudoalteromonas tunicata]EAR28737.1 putative orphan protein; putative signal peptide [Pseudoalteromonas tunicata D2]